MLRYVHKRMKNNFSGSLVTESLNLDHLAEKKLVAKEAQCFEIDFLAVSQLRTCRPPPPPFWSIFMDDGSVIL